MPAHKIKEYETSIERFGIHRNLCINNRLYIIRMLRIEKVTIINGEVWDTISKTPIMVSGLTPEEFKANVRALFRCDRVLLTYTVEEDDNKD